ncbi:hypothetical protein BDA99DRAFT_148423 [Phascolomyces articulosus]|uniref:DUSP domain-containing protein n=1 Tax=Phascolomyces articulosus TaxID=60185 RepID=A0AAD5K4Y3_9FUNG|nr:hypothetical protein BDA99DRAFT_148423 [Phascolomyces articulosus]
MNPKGFCFVSAQFMWEWERFIEGWRILPPTDENMTLNNQHHLLDSGSNNEQQQQETNRIRFDPFLPESTDLHIVSHETWEYLCQHYNRGGPKITKGNKKVVIIFYFVARLCFSFATVLTICYLISIICIDDLMRSDIHKQWQYTIKRYADRVMLRF